MRARLTSTLDVFVVHAFAVMAFSERRPELALVCKEAVKRDGQLDVDAVRAASPPLTEAAARRVVRSCAELGLCTERGVLTEHGRGAAQSERVLVEEQGVYRLFVARHPALGTRILHVDRVRPADVPQGGRDRFPVDLSCPLRWESIFVDGFAGELRRLPSGDGAPACVVETRAQLSLWWEVDFEARCDELSIRGKLSLGKRELVSRHVGESVGLDFDAVRRRCAAAVLGGRWVEDRFVGVDLERVHEGALGPDAFDAFRARIEGAGYFDVPGRGKWSVAHLVDVPVGPRTAEEAADWWMALLARDVAEEPSYWPWAKVRERLVVRARNTPIAHFEPALPDAERLWREVAQRNGSWPWNLSASVDLAPAALRANLDVAAQPWPIEAAEEVPAGYQPVRIELDGERSLRELVSELVGEGARRVLLVDRYVTGERALAALRALKACLPREAELEVWTRRHGDAQRIEEVVGRGRLRALEDVFVKGRDPHDRYLVVVYGEGEAVLWHMTNSVLAGKVRDRGRLDDPDVPRTWPSFLAAPRTIREEGWAEAWVNGDVPGDEERRNVA